MLYEDFEEQFYKALKQHLEGDYQIEVYQSLIREQPDNSFLKYLLADSYFRTGNLELADILSKEAIAMNSNIEFKPDFSNINSVIILAFGTILTKENPYTNKNFEQVLTSKNVWDSVYANTGAMYLGCNDISNAYRVAMSGLEKFPNSRLIKKLLYLTLLRSKNLAGAWGFFETKVKSLEKETEFFMQKPEYNFQDKRATIYLYHSGTISDTLLFSRFINPLQDMGLKFILAPQPELYGLFKSSGFEINKFQPELDEFDYRLSFMSLPYLFKSDLENMPSKDGYFKADDSKYIYFNQKYFLTEKKKIGLVWSVEDKKSISIPLSTLTPILENQNLQFYSFKKDLTEEEKEILFSHNVIDLSSEFNDYSDIASAITNTDIFIGNDTAETNLAAALGTKTIALLPAAADWKWGIWEEKTPWYNSVTALRQKIQGAWDEVITRVKIRLD